MAGAIQNNIRLLKYNIEMDKQLLERENENLNMKNLLYQTELKSLQAQINPHFLFNTLNMIAKKAALSGDSETNLLMENISALLRYGLDKANKISTLKEELSCIENYFFIQQRRFEGRVSFVMDVPDYVPDISMPAMTLQPLVENSVIHGIKDVLENAEVILTRDLVYSRGRQWLAWSLRISKSCRLLCVWTLCAKNRTEDTLD